MNFLRFFLICSALLFFCAGILAAAIQQYGSAEHYAAAAIGSAMSYVNALAGYALIAWGIRQPHKQFMTAVFGGIILRFLLIFALLFILIGALEFSKVALVGSLVATYFVFLGLEIVYLHLFTDVERKVI